jgi:hypothetical protein
MPTWGELDQQFRELAPALRRYRIFYVWGGEDVTELRGDGYEPERQRFEALAQIAGQKLSEIRRTEVEPAVLGRSPGRARWYEALRRHSGVFHESGGGRSTVAGEEQPPTFSGYVANPAEVSATLALQMSHLPLSWWAWIKAKKVSLGSAAAGVAILGYLGVHPWWVKTVTPPPAPSYAPAPVNVAPSSAPVPVIASAPAATSATKPDVASTPHRERKHATQPPYFQNPEADLRGVIPYMGDLSTLAATIKRAYTESAASHEPNSTLQKFAYQWAADEIVRSVWHGQITLRGTLPNEVGSTEIPRELWRGARLIALVGNRGVVLRIVAQHRDTSAGRPSFAPTDEDERRVEPYTHYESITTDGRTIEELWPRAVP